MKNKETLLALISGFMFAFLWVFNLDKLAYKITILNKVFYFVPIDVCAFCFFAGVLILPLGLKENDNTS